MTPDAQSKLLLNQMTKQVLPLNTQDPLHDKSLFWNDIVNHQSW